MVQFKARGERSALKKAIAQSNWDEALQQGIEVLIANPWDVPTLTANGHGLRRHSASGRPLGRGHLRRLRALFT